MNTAMARQQFVSLCVTHTQHTFVCVCVNASVRISNVIGKRQVYSATIFAFSLLKVIASIKPIQPPFEELRLFHIRLPNIIDRIPLCETLGVLIEAYGIRFHKNYSSLLPNYVS